jgi:hypothetical protein
MFRSRQTGQIAIAQFPNLALWIVIAAAIARRIVSSGSAARTVIDWAAALSLIWWSVDELVRGVNPWRRLLGVGGAAVAVGAVMSLLR